MKTIKEKLEKIHNYDFDKEMIFVEDVLKLIDEFGDSHNDCCLALINILKSKIEGN